MNTILMKRFGKTLTDRQYGKQMAQELLKTEEFPITLDFSEVIALGSSFGDEIISMMKSQQKPPFHISNANLAVKHCLQKIAIDYNVSLTFNS